MRRDRLPRALVQIAARRSGRLRRGGGVVEIEVQIDPDDPHRPYWSVYGSVISGHPGDMLRAAKAVASLLRDLASLGVIDGRSVGSGS